MGATSTSNDEVSWKDGFKNQALSFLLVLAILVAGFLGWIYWNRFQEVFALQAEIKDLKAERVSLKKDISSLKEEVNRRNDLQYIERLAKQELGLVYPSEENPQQTE